MFAFRVLSNFSLKLFVLNAFSALSTQANWKKGKPTSKVRSQFIYKRHKRTNKCCSWHCVFSSVLCACVSVWVCECVNELCPPDVSAIQAGNMTIPPATAHQKVQQQYFVMRLGTNHKYSCIYAGGVPLPLSTPTAAHFLGESSCVSVSFLFKSLQLTGMAICIFCTIWSWLSLIDLFKI